MVDRRPAKRTRHTLNVQHDRIPIEDDFEVLHSRTSSLHGPRHLPFDSARSPLRGRTTWTIGQTWAPEDDPEFSLDSDDELYEMEMEADVGEVMDIPPVDEKDGAKVKKSQVSVCLRFHSFVYPTDKKIGTTSSRMEVELETAISRRNAAPRRSRRFYSRNALS